MSILNVTCPYCHVPIGKYDGPVRPGIPIESNRFTFQDGSHPKPGTNATFKCPNCKEPFNIVLALKNIVSSESTPRDT